MNTLIGVGILVILVTAGLIAWRMTVSGQVRVRDYRRVKRELREARLALHQIGRKTRVWRPSLDDAGLAYADDVTALIEQHDQMLMKEQFEIEERDL